MVTFYDIDKIYDLEQFYNTIFRDDIYAVISGWLGSTEKLVSLMLSKVNYYFFYSKKKEKRNCISNPYVPITLTSK